MAETASEQLAWEAKAGRVAAGAAALSLVLFIAGSVYGLTANSRRQPRTIGDLVSVGRDPLDFVVPAVIAGLAFVLLSVVLGYLYRATKFRRNQLPAAALALLVFGAIAAGATLVAQRIDIVSAAQGYAAGVDPSSPVRKELQGRVSLQVILGLNLGGYLALGMSTVLISVSAMRAGLFSRFLGILGVVAALSLLLPLLPLQVLFMFWLGALAALFLDRWPGGRGPAWARGEAVAWPTMAERNAEIDRRRTALDENEDSDADPAKGQIEGSADAGAEGADAEHPGNGGPPAARQRAKRKRGRRG